MEGIFLLIAYLTWDQQILLDYLVDHLLYHIFVVVKVPKRFNLIIREHYSQYCINNMPIKNDGNFGRKITCIIWYWTSYDINPQNSYQVPGTVADTFLMWYLVMLLRRVPDISMHLHLPREQLLYGTGRTVAFRTRYRLQFYSVARPHTFC